VNYNLLNLNIISVETGFYIKANKTLILIFIVKLMATINRQWYNQTNLSIMISTNGAYMLCRQLTFITAESSGMMSSSYPRRGV